MGMGDFLSYISTGTTQEEDDRRKRVEELALSEAERKRKRDQEAMDIIARMKMNQAQAADMSANEEDAAVANANAELAAGDYKSVGGQLSGLKPPTSGMPEPAMPPAKEWKGLEDVAKIKTPKEQFSYAAGELGHVADTDVAKAYMGNLGDIANPSSGGGFAGKSKQALDYINEIDAMPETTPEEKATKARAYEKLIESGYISSSGFDRTDNGVRFRIDAKIKELNETSGPAAAAAAQKQFATTMADADAQQKAIKLLGLSRIDPSTNKPYTQDNFVTGVYANRMHEANRTLDELSEKKYDPSSIKNAVMSHDAMNLIKDPNQRAYAQAMRNFINATLRRESGAAIAPSEFDSANKQYFAQMGDDPATLEQKRDARIQTESGFTAQAGGAYTLIQDEYEKERRSANMKPRKGSSSAGGGSGKWVVGPDGVARKQ